GRLRPRSRRPVAGRTAAGAEAGRCRGERNLALQMDSITPPFSEPARSALPTAPAELFPQVDALASMPARSPLEMPTQSFARYDRSRGQGRGTRRWSWRVGLARVAVFGGAIGLTAYGANEMYGVLAVGGVTTLEWVLLILFVINFSWISLALTNAIVGLAAM